MFSLVNLLTELDSLNWKFNRLKDFLRSEEYKELDIKEANMIHEQCSAMSSYQRILKKRVNNVRTS